MSRLFGLGLRRTGTIALGASHCDFRYELGGEPRALRSQYDLPLAERNASVSSAPMGKPKRDAPSAG